MAKFKCIAGVKTAEFEFEVEDSRLAGLGRTQRENLIAEELSLVIWDYLDIHYEELDDKD